MAKKQIEISDLKDAPYNPRKISDEVLGKLVRSINEFGDLSGVVYNRQTGHLVGGHQRLKAFKELGATLEVEAEFDKPTEKGTVAFAYLRVGGEKYACRVVEWDEAKERLANLAANKITGEWDEAKLPAMFAALVEFGADTGLTGFTADEVGFYTLGADDVDDDFDLPDGDKGPTEQITFTLSNKEAATVREALGMARDNATPDDVNENRDGNALAYVCQQFLEGLDG